MGKIISTALVLFDTVSLFLLTSILSVPSIAIDLKMLVAAVNIIYLSISTFFLIRKNKKKE